MSGALETQGVRLQRGDGGSPEVFGDIGEVVSFRGPGGSARVIDVTHLMSTAKEKRMGLPDEGQFTFDVNYVPSDPGQVGLRNDRINRTQRNFQIRLTDAGPTIGSFAGFVLEFSISGGVDDKINGSVTIEITGPVTWA